MVVYIEVNMIITIKFQKRNLIKTIFYHIALNLSSFFIPFQRQIEISFLQQLNYRNHFC